MFLLFFGVVEIWGSSWCRGLWWCLIICNCVVVYVGFGDYLCLLFFVVWVVCFELCLWVLLMVSCGDSFDFMLMMILEWIVKDCVFLVLFGFLWVVWSFMFCSDELVFSLWINFLIVWLFEVELVILIW